MRISKFLYFGDFFAIPVAVTVLTYFALTAGGLWAVLNLGVSLLIGLATWTLVEYAVHRLVYHHAPVFSALHDSHHQAPNEFIGVPSFVSSGFIIVVGTVKANKYRPLSAPIRPSASVIHEQKQWSSAPP